MVGRPSSNSERLLVDSDPSSNSILSIINDCLWWELSFDLTAGDSTRTRLYDPRLRRKAGLLRKLPGFGGPGGALLCEDFDLTSGKH